MGTPTRWPSGASVNSKGTLFGNIPVPCRLTVHDYENDFDQYVAGDWTVTTTAGTSALTAGNGGILTLTTAAANNDIQANIKNPAAFQFVQGAPLWFAVNLTRGDAVNNVIAGLMAGGTPFAPGNGVYFTCATGQNLVNLNINLGGTITTIAGVTSLVPATPTTLGFYFDGASIPTLWAFSSAGITPVAFGQTAQLGGNMVAAAGGPTPVNSLANLPTVVLSQGFGIQATAVAAKTLAVDFILASNSILRA